MEEAFQSGSITVQISKAVVQGPARAGKTSLKCLITDEPYKEDSTGCVEAPKVAINKYSSSDDGVCWKLLKDDEVLNIALRLYEDAQQNQYAALENNEQCQREEKHTAKTSTKESTSSLHGSSSSSQDNISDIVDSLTSSSLDSLDIVTTVDNLNFSTFLTPEHKADKIMKQAKEAIKNIKSSVNASTDVCKDWLYFIDSGGQIQFQQLLHAFLPCASLLLLVTNISEDLSDPSSTKILHKGKEYNFSKYSLTNEEVLERIILLIDSCCQKQREAIENNAFLKAKIKIPERLNIWAVATHSDKFKNEEIICKKQQRFYEILSKFDGFVPPNPHNKEALFIVDGRQAKEAIHSKNEVALEISKKLRQQAFKVEIPLRWYVFELLLRKLAETFPGVFTLDICQKIGKKQLNMKRDDVKNALKFFHLLNTVLYYPTDNTNDDESDLVFVSPDNLFEIITELTIAICKLQNGESIDSLQENFTVKDAHRAIVPEDFLSVSEVIRTVLEYIPNFTSKLLLLFERLCIAKMIQYNGINKFFIPALLPLTDPKIAVKSTDFCPYIFLFEKSAPIGFLCKLIVHLLSIGTRHKGWRIPPSSDIKFYSNCLTLRWNSKCNVQFIEYRNRCEIYSDHSEHRPSIRKELDEAVDALKEKTFPALQCPCSQADPHFAEIIEGEAKEVRCQENDKKVLKHETDCDSCWSWMMIHEGNGMHIYQKVFAQACIYNRNNIIKVSYYRTKW